MRLTDIVSVMSILKNPMILMAGAACLMMFGMPYLIDNSTYISPMAAAGLTTSASTKYLEWS